MESQYILENIPELSSADNAIFKSLNVSIRKFNKYKEI